MHVKLECFKSRNEEMIKLREYYLIPFYVLQCLNSLTGFMCTQYYDLLKVCFLAMKKQRFVVLGCNLHGERFSFVTRMSA